MSRCRSGNFEKVKLTGNKAAGKLVAEVQGQPMSIDFEGAVDGDKISGTLNVPGIGVVPFTGSRTK